jgi:hypothetical protein
MVKICNENNPKAKNDAYICNPTTGIWVLKTGAIGKKLIQGGGSPKGGGSKSKSCNTNLDKAKDDKYICNPATGNWVLKSGKIGQAILKQVKPKSPPIKIKPKSPPIKIKPKTPYIPKHNPPTSLYKNQLYKSKKKYGLIIPLLDKLNISYETWNNKDNTMGTCFWHAVSKGLGITLPEIANKIENMVESLPGNLKYKYKTKEYVANKLKNYKKTGFGMGPKGYCIVPKIAPDTALIIFAVKEVKPKQFNTIGVFCVMPEKVVPTKVIFLVDYVFLKGAHIEIMTLKGKKINTSWSQNIKDVAEELKSILSVRPTCKKLLKKLQIK